MASAIQRLTLIVLSLTLNSAVAASAEDASTNKTPAATASTNQPSKAPRVRVTISKETTYITAPLRKDGYPDYVAALNERCSRGVTPENNAAVLFWKAFGPGEIPKPHRERFFKMLGIPPLPEEGEYFVYFGEHVKRLKKDGRLPSAQSGEDAEHAPWTEFRVSQERPWSAKDFPVVVDWLKANERMIAMLADAAKRPRYYAPAVSENVLLASGELPTIQQSREVGRAMLSRAMQRIGAEKTDDAWADVLACHRVARLYAQRPSLVDALVADAIDGMACSADQALLEHARLSAPQALRMRDDLGQLPRVSRMADAEEGDRRAQRRGSQNAPGDEWRDVAHPAAAFQPPARCLASTG